MQASSFLPADLKGSNAFTMDGVYTIGITGGSASGKTTLARALAVSLEEFNPVILGQDRYFRDWSDIHPEDRERARTANRAEAIAWPAYMEAVRRIQAGEPIEEPAPGTRARQLGTCSR